MRTYITSYILSIEHFVNNGQYTHMEPYFKLWNFPTQIGDFAIPPAPPANKTIVHTLTHTSPASVNARDKALLKEIQAILL